MQIEVLMWILGGGFAGTWGLCLFFMNRTDNAIAEMKRDVRQDITEIRREMSELHKCVRDYNGRISEIETEMEMDKCQHK